MIGGDPRRSDSLGDIVGDGPPAQPLSLLAVLQEEFEELHGAAVASGSPIASITAGEPSDTLEDLYQRIHNLAVPRAALCLSGGGIRSASFALGVLQALARYGLLGQFHYLSTVSGGGYIGSFLSAWRCHQGDDNAIFTRLITSGVFAGFGEPAELRQLRANNNFLSPKFGLFSPDARARSTLYIRNLLLNWLIFGPLFLSVLVFPHASFDVIVWLNDVLGAGAWLALLAAALLLLSGLAASVAGRPARDRLNQRGLPERPVAPDRSRFVWLILLPLCFGAGFLATFAAWLPTTPDGMHWGILLIHSHEKEVFYSIIYPMGIGAILYAAAWLIGFFTGGGDFAELLRIAGRRRNPVPPLAEMICYTLSGAVAGMIVTAGIALYQHLSGFGRGTKPIRASRRPVRRLQPNLPDRNCWRVLDHDCCYRRGAALYRIDQLPPVWRSGPGMVSAGGRLSRSRGDRMALFCGNRTLRPSDVRSVRQQDLRYRGRAIGTGYPLAQQWREGRG